VGGKDSTPTSGRSWRWRLTRGCAPELRARWPLVLIGGDWAGVGGRGLRRRRGRLGWRRTHGFSGGVDDAVLPAIFRGARCAGVGDERGNVWAESGGGDGVRVSGGWVARICRCCARWQVRRRCIVISRSTAAAGAALAADVHDDYGLVAVERSGCGAGGRTSVMRDWRGSGWGRCWRCWRGGDDDGRARVETARSGRGLRVGRRGGVANALLRERQPGIYGYGVVVLIGVGFQRVNPDSEPEHGAFDLGDRGVVGVAELARRARGGRRGSMGGRNGSGRDGGGAGVACAGVCGAAGADFDRGVFDFCVGRGGARGWAAGRDGRRRFRWRSCCLQCR